MIIIQYNFQTSCDTYRYVLGTNDDFWEVKAKEQGQTNHDQRYSHHEAGAHA